MLTRRVFFIVVVAALIVPALAILPSAGAQDDLQSNKALLRRYIEEYHNQQRVEVADEILSADFVLHMAKQRELDPSGLLALFQWFWSSCGQPQWTLLTVIAEGDFVAGTYTWEGCNTKVAGITVLSIKNGKITEGWDIWDTGQEGQEFREVQLDLGIGSPEANKALVADLWTNWTSLTEELLAEDFALYPPQSEYGDEPYDLAESQNWATDILAAFPDIGLIPYGDQEEPVMVAEGDLVVTVNDVQGTFKNEYSGMNFGSDMGVPLKPNGNVIRFTAIELARIKDDKITEIWLYWDTSALSRQLVARAKAK